MGMLGMRVKDKVTGAKGVVTSISFDLYGCVQAVVNPGIGKDGKPMDCGWFDIARLEVACPRRVMPLPDFHNGAVAEGKKGPSEKPFSARW